MRYVQTYIVYMVYLVPIVPIVPVSDHHPPRSSTHYVHGTWSVAQSHMRTPAQPPLPTSVAHMSTQTSTCKSLSLSPMTDFVTALPADLPP